ncbi:MAG: nucleotidyltransferase, partial [Rhodospirillales bacterium]|nr:nucleotidyltransferase [Rhodospirillales bacterium]
FTFQTDIRALDLLGYVEPLGGYDEILKNAVTHDIAGHSVKVISLDDLIRIKEHIQRPKDRESLMHLRAIKQVRDEQKHDDESS